MYSEITDDILACRTRDEVRDLMGGKAKTYPEETGPADFGGRYADGWHTGTEKEIDNLCDNVAGPVEKMYGRRAAAALIKEELDDKYALHEYLTGGIEGLRRYLMQYL